MSVRLFLILNPFMISFLPLKLILILTLTYQVTFFTLDIFGIVPFVAKKGIIPDIFYINILLPGCCTRFHVL